MTDLHCVSRLVHSPEAHCKPLPQSWPSGAVLSAGQAPPSPGQTSLGSHVPVLARHTVPFAENWQLEQQESFASSQTAPFTNLQVDASQQGSSPQPASPPQSHSSPLSTIPFPHCGPEKVATFLLFERHDVSTDFRPIALQMFPIVQGLNALLPGCEYGFMMNCEFAEHVLAV